MATAPVASIPRGTNGKHPAVPPILDADARADIVLKIPLGDIDVGPNVRVNVDAIDELAASIKEHGVLQPIKVRRVGDRYLITWGQRRYLAAKLAGLARIPALVEEDADKPGEQLATEQLVENLHRADLNPIDRARAMRQVIDAGLSQVDLATKLGIGASTVANDLRLLEASSAVHVALEKGAITASHAKAMLPLPAKDQEYFVKRVETGGLSAHRLEEEVGWKLQTLRGEELTKKRVVTAIPKAIAALEAADVAKGTQVHVVGRYNLPAEPIAAAVKKAGWKIAALYLWERGSAAKCDCQVVLLDFDRKWVVTPGCVEPRHRDRQVNTDHVAEETRRKAIAEKLTRLGELVAAVLEGLPPELVKLLSSTHRNDLADAWAREDLAEARSRAGQRIAQAADTTYVWPEKDRQAHDATLDEVLAAFEALVEAATPA